MSKEIAKGLLKIQAVFLRPNEPFTWASGIKSPIYCDNRLTLTAPVVRGHVEAGLAEIVRTKFPEAEVLMGTSTAPPELHTLQSLHIFWICQWVTFAAAQKPMAGTIELKESWKREIRWSLLKT